MPVSEPQAYTNKLQADIEIPHSLLMLMLYLEHISHQAGFLTHRSSRAFSFLHISIYAMAPKGILPVYSDQFVQAFHLIPSFSQRQRSYPYLSPGMHI